MPSRVAQTGTTVPVISTTTRPNCSRGIFLRLNVRRQEGAPAAIRVGSVSERGGPWRDRAPLDAAAHPIGGVRGAPVGCAVNGGATPDPCAENVAGATISAHDPRANDPRTTPPRARAART